MSPDQPDEVTALEAELFSSVIWLIRLRLKATVEQRVKDLEALTGRELPEVRAQLGQLYHPPKELGPARPPVDDSGGGSPPPKRGPGRPRKNPSDIASLTDDEPV